MNRFIMLVGLPGSGKTYVAENYFAEATHLSSDAIREEMYGDANEQKNPSAVFNKMNNRLFRALKNGENVVYDATNINSRKRTALVNDIHSRCPDTQCFCVIVLCSIKECKRRQDNRDRKVPGYVIDRMARNFQVPYFHEGWDAIYLHEAGELQKITREHERLMETSHDNPHHTHSIGYHCTQALSAMTNLLAEQTEPTTTTEMDDIKAVLKEAAYQHDIGKRKAKVFTNRKGEPSDIAHYYGHECLGAYMWLSGDEHAKWDDWSFLTIGLLIQWHMQPYALPHRSKEELVAWCKNRHFDPWIADWIWLIHEADQAAH